uniref:Uncharacterized protein n=1 Tax=Candidatus Kentrum sp. FW TaxID=2126338 RepID=A0A450RZL0_9GAMM|nr:MAG: hypothetical protein BECKFW1821A_GA0114235_100737 [Candidatus Kentron sp. FW]VFJ54198.1 MAG: hypothetical protein BECKFW1821B_GA0114236_101728 [Candidatus Kentron sp. FW]
MKPCSFVASGIYPDSHHPSDPYPHARSSFILKQADIIPVDKTSITFPVGQFVENFVLDQFGKEVIGHWIKDMGQFLSIYVSSSPGERGGTFPFG